MKRILAAAAVLALAAGCSSKSGPSEDEIADARKKAAAAAAAREANRVPTAVLTALRKACPKLGRGGLSGWDVRPINNVARGESRCEFDYRCSTFGWRYEYVVEATKADRTLRWYISGVGVPGIVTQDDLSASYCGLLPSHNGMDPHRYVPAFVDLPRDPFGPAAMTDTTVSGPPLIDPSTTYANAASAVALLMDKCDRVANEQGHLRPFKVQRLTYKGDAACRKSPTCRDLGWRTEYRVEGGPFRWHIGTTKEMGGIASFGLKAGQMCGTGDPDAEYTIYKVGPYLLEGW